MTRMVVHTRRVDGMVAVTNPGTNGQALILTDAGAHSADMVLVYPDRKTPETDDEFLQRLVVQKTEDATDTPRIMELADLPYPDKHFRAAWVFNGALVEQDRAKAEAIHMGRIRQSRDAELVVLDKEHRQASGDAARQASIDAKAQVLRDIPQTFDISVRVVPTLDDLHALWPAGLPRD